MKKFIKFKFGPWYFPNSVCLELKYIIYSDLDEELFGNGICLRIGLQPDFENVI